MFCRMTSVISKLTAAAGEKSQSFLSRESCGQACSGRKACGTGLIAYDFKYICSSSTLCPYIMFDGVYNCFTSRGIKAWLLLHCMNISGAHQLWWIGPSLFYACILNHYIVTYIVRENSLGRTKGRYWAVKLRSHSPKNTTVTSALHWRLL